jgi:hypothetical protein
MALSVRVTGLDAHGVDLFSPTRPEFDELAWPLLGERIANLGLRLKPMLVIVSNENVRTIVSLALIWHVIHRDGTTGRYWSHTSFPDVICGDADHDSVGFETGQRRIDAYGVAIHGWSQWDEYFDQSLGHFVEQKQALLADAVDLHIELNAVIFADGTLIGADDGVGLYIGGLGTRLTLRDLFSAYVHAKHAWYRGIIEALDAGQSVADSFAPVERFLTDTTNRMRAGHSMEDKPDDLWTRQAAAEARSWQRRHADKDIPTQLRQAIRLNPFIIRRS